VEFIHEIKNGKRNAIISRNWWSV